MYHHRYGASMKQTSPSFFCVSEQHPLPAGMGKMAEMIFGKGKKRGGSFWEFNSFIFGHWGDLHKERIGKGKVVLRLFQRIIKQHWWEVSHSFFDIVSSYPFKSLLSSFVFLVLAEFLFFSYHHDFLFPIFSKPLWWFGVGRHPRAFPTKTGGWSCQVPSEVLACTCSGIAESLGRGACQLSSLEVQDTGCNWFLL